MRIKIYDGANSIGGTKLYVSDKNGGIFLDFGVNFQRMGLYYKEYIKRRAVRGINDAVTLRILPKIDVYREDLIPSDLPVHDFEKIKLSGILVTHAHMDHFGEIGNVRFDVPLLASSLTLLLIKAMQDCGRNSLVGEAVYSSKRIPSQDTRILRNTGRRKGAGVFTRPLIFGDKATDGIVRFLEMHPSANKSRHFEELKIEDTEVLPFEIRCHPVDHSIYGACGFLVEGDTTLAYTGDIRLHGEKGKNTEEFALHARDADILIIEGTRLSEREHSRVTEEEVKNRLREEMEDFPAMIIVDFSARNFERLKEVIDIADEREVVVTQKDAYLLYALEQAGVRLLQNNVRVYRSLQAQKASWLSYLEENWGLEERYVDPEEIKKNPENYILSFSLYDMPNLLDIKPRGGRYIYSSTEALTEEQELDFFTLYNWLRRFDFEIRGFSIVDGKLRFERGYHASGHASPEEIERIIEIADPDKIIPVHTTNPEWFVQHFPEKTMVLKNGDEVRV